MSSALPAIADIEADISAVDFLGQLLRACRWPLPGARDPPRANPCTRKTLVPSTRWYDALFRNHCRRGASSATCAGM